MRIGRSRARCGSDDRRARSPRSSSRSRPPDAPAPLVVKDASRSVVGAARRVAAPARSCGRTSCAPSSPSRVSHLTRRPLAAHRRRRLDRGRGGGAIRRASATRRYQLARRPGSSEGRALRPAPARRRAGPAHRRQSRVGRRALRAPRVLVHDSATRIARSRRPDGPRRPRRATASTTCVGRAHHARRRGRGVGGAARPAALAATRGGRRGARRARCAACAARSAAARASPRRTSRSPSRSASARRSASAASTSKYTRTTDTLIALSDRGRIANEAHARPVREHPRERGEPGMEGSAARARGFETYFLAEAKTEDARRVEQMENEVGQVRDARRRRASGDPLSFILNDMAQNEHLRESNELAELIQRRLGRVHPGPEPRREAGRVPRAGHRVHAGRARRDRLRHERQPRPRT